MVLVDSWHGPEVVSSLPFLLVRTRDMAEIYITLITLVVTAQCLHAVDLVVWLAICICFAVFFWLVSSLFLQLYGCFPTIVWFSCCLILTCCISCSGSVALFRGQMSLSWADCSPSMFPAVHSPPLVIVTHLHSPTLTNLHYLKLTQTH